MDIVTQVVLGAAVGEVVAGRTMGRKALLAGAVAGAIPDIDVIWGHFLSDVSLFAGHRAWTHSLFVAPLAALLFAWFLSRWKACSCASFGTWFYLLSWCFVTHILLDLCTTYGTQIFLPFSDEGYDLSSISIVDPLYTLPLLVAVGVLLVVRFSPRKRLYIASICLFLSSVYLVTTLLTKQHVEKRFQDIFVTHCPTVENYLVHSHQFTIFTWRAVGMTPEGYVVGHYSLLQKPQHATLTFFPYHVFRSWLLEESLRQPELEKLVRFSKKFFKLETKNNELVLVDLRFSGNHPFHFVVANLVAGDMVHKNPIVLSESSSRGQYANAVSHWLVKLFGKFSSLAVKTNDASVIPGSLMACVSPTKGTAVPHT